MRPEEFIESLLPGAQALQRQTRLFTSLTIAQAALETGWGRFIPVDKDDGQESNNLFGIKGTGPAGSVLCWTEEELQDGSRIRILAKFRAYNNFDECLQDRYEVLLQPRYDRVREASTPEAAAGFLYVCGYATDSEYPQKLTKIMHDFDLKQYDSLPDLPDDPLRDVPEWARAPVEWAMSAGVIADPVGSEDFYRGITALWNYDRMKG